MPFRDREEHLRTFLLHMHSFLPRQQVDYKIFIVEQVGNGTFNRAMLFNVGVAEALKGYDFQCFIFHDVDLLPEDARNLYTCPVQPRHMSVAVNTFDYKLLYKGSPGIFNPKLFNHNFIVYEKNIYYFDWYTFQFIDIQIVLLT